MTFQSTKTFGNDRGLSCCFRQWRSTHSHCSTLHGYSIGVKVIIESENLDQRNWVFDFGAFKPFKQWLEHMFDHTVLIAKDDPHLQTFKELAAFYDPNSVQPMSQVPHERGAVIDLRIVDAVGCEAFAKMAFEKMQEVLQGYSFNKSCFVKSVEVFEHGANSALYLGEK